MENKRPYKRKMLNFSIHPSMQLRMIGKIATILFLSLLLSSLVFYYFADQEITQSFRLFHIRARNFLDFLLPVVSASFFISLLCGAVASLFFPKNYAGALYRIEEEVKRFAAMDLSTSIVLRKKDENISLADQINLMVEGFCHKFHNIQDAADEARTLCADEEIFEGNREKLLELIDVICCETRKVKYPHSKYVVQKFA